MFTYLMVNLAIFVEKWISAKILDGYIFQIKIKPNV